MYIIHQFGRRDAKVKHRFHPFPVGIYLVIAVTHINLVLCTYVHNTMYIKIWALLQHNTPAWSHYKILILSYNIYILVLGMYYISISYIHVHLLVQLACTCPTKQWPDGFRRRREIVEHRIYIVIIIIWVGTYDEGIVELIILQVVLSNSTIPTKNKMFGLHSRLKKMQCCTRDLIIRP